MQVRTLEIIPDIGEFFLFDVSKSVAFMEATRSEITILSHADIVSADGASA